MEIALSFLKWLNVVPVPLLDGQASVVKARAMLDANYLGVFHAVAEAGASGAEASFIQQRCELSSEGSEVLLRALVSIGYLSKQGSHYSNSGWVIKWILDPKKGLHNLLKLQRYTYMRLGDLAENLKSGRPTMDVHAKSVSSVTPQQEIYTRAMREAARMILPQFLKKLEMPAGATKLLDIGGAHGEYSRTLRAKYPQLKPRVIDLAGPISTARAIMQEEGETDSLDLVVGNALEDDFGEGWDAILLANMVHLFNVEQNLDLFRRCRKALNPGGTLLAMDQYTGLGGRRDYIFATISLNFFNVGGKSYDVAQMRQLLTEAGFSRVDVKPFSLTTPGALIQAWA